MAYKFVNFNKRGLVKNHCWLVARFDTCLPNVDAVIIFFCSEITFAKFYWFVFYLCSSFFQQ